MNEKKIFEIPIYSTSERKFNIKWNKKRESIIKNCKEQNCSLEITKLVICNECFPYSLWRYNQIIGYIIISVSKQDVWFELYKSLDKTYRINIKKKHYIQDMHINGCHFHVDSRMTDKEIKTEIEDLYTMIKNEFVDKRFFIDDTLYSSLIGYIDIREIINDL